MYCSYKKIIAIILYPPFCSSLLEVMSNLSVKDLKTETGVTDYQLKQKCQDEHLRKISLYVGGKRHNRHDLVTKFGLLPALITGIQNDPSLSFAQQTQKMFTCWRDNNMNATYLEFVQVCLELGNGDLASKMCEICIYIIIHNIMLCMVSITSAKPLH